MPPRSSCDSWPSGARLRLLRTETGRGSASAKFLPVLLGTLYRLQGLFGVVEAFRSGVLDLTDKILWNAVASGTRSGLPVGREIDALQILLYVSQGAQIHACPLASACASHAPSDPLWCMPQTARAGVPQNLGSVVGKACLDAGSEVDQGRRRMHSGIGCSSQR